MIQDPNIIKNYVKIGYLILFNQHIFCYIFMSFNLIVAYCVFLIFKNNFILYKKSTSRQYFIKNF